LLKLRFGEAALQGCDVMLKDMADSKRIDDNVQGDIKVSGQVENIRRAADPSQSTVHPIVISRLFWPQIPASSLRLTPKLET
jgi:anaphase-promoting complex subunit 2